MSRPRRGWRGVRGLLRRRLRPTSIERRIAALGLRPGDVAIDCGANIGEVSVALARTGAEVHAFEPNPHAFCILAKRLGQNENVHLHPQAVLDRAGTARLYLHVDAAEDPIRGSVGSSLLATKGNVDSENFVEVETIDLAQFILDREQLIRFVKIDVEGVECALVHRLLDTGAIDRIEKVFVELHDGHIPELRYENRRLRERLEHDGLAARVRTDWT